VSNFVITYYGFPRFERPEDGGAYMKMWRAWMAGIGEAMINPGTPMKIGKTLSANGISDTSRGEPLTGFSIVKADSLEAAVAMARGRPHLAHGAIDVAEAMDMGMT
jgi:hypothetical protein